MAIRAKFKPTPEGEFHPGIPARDLDDLDWVELSNEQRDLVRGSKLYRYVPQLTRAQRQARATQDPEAEVPAEESSQPDDAVTEEPAVAAEEGETN